MIVLKFDYHPACSKTTLIRGLDNLDYLYNVTKGEIVLKSGYRGLSVIWMKKAH